MLEARLARVENLKKVFDAYEELLHEGTLKWTKDGLELLMLDAHQVTAVQLDFPSTCFESFQCSSSKSCGLRLATLIRIVASMRPNDSATFFVSEAANVLTIQHNSKRRQCKLHFVVPRTLKEEASEACTMEMPTAQFCNIVHKLAKVSKTIKIGCTKDDQVEFSAQGLDGTECKETVSNELNRIKTNHPILQFFAAEYLMLLGSAEPFCPNVRIVLRANFPIAAEYKVENNYNSLLLTCYLPPLAI